MSNNAKLTSTLNNFIENKIKYNKIIKQNIDETNNFDDINTLHDEIEIEKLENELYVKSHSINYPKNYGNL